MAKVFIEESTLTSIGDAIRSKTGKTALIPTLDMPTEIRSISGGGGGELEISPEDLILTDNQSYRFYTGKWQWFLDKYGEYMSTNNLTYCEYMFNASKELVEVPFELNCRPNYALLNYSFGQCSKLTTPPKVNVSGELYDGNTFNISNMFSNCTYLRNADNAFNPEALESLLSNFVATSSSSFPKMNNIFSGCVSLRTVPSWFSKLKVSSSSMVYPTNSYGLYYSVFSGCNTLDEVIDMPVLNYNTYQTSNMFSSSFSQCGRLKNLTFKLDNGTPYTVKWKSQTIDLSSYIGYMSNISNLANSGLTSAKRVTDDETYQALKDDPDWYTSSSFYSRYNHDSAVATINSLPDASAYLASAGGTNTIKFKGAAGELTDGGAINTLTEEEIAVATAKGWTVTLA